MQKPPELKPQLDSRDIDFICRKWFELKALYNDPEELERMQMISTFHHAECLSYKVGRILQELTIKNNTHGRTYTRFYLAFTRFNLIIVLAELGPSILLGDSHLYLSDDKLDKLYNIASLLKHCGLPDEGAAIKVS